MDNEEDLKILTQDSFETLCRTCLVRPDILYHVFDISFENQSIRDLLKEYFSIQVEDDELPKHICESCILNLCEVRTFRNLCRQSSSLFEQVLDGDGVVAKQENIEIEFDPELVVLVGDSEPCVECPTAYNLPYTLQCRLVHNRTAELLCASCGASYDIEYNGICTRNTEHHAIEKKPEILTKASLEHLCRTCNSKPDVSYEIFDISYEGIAMKDLLNDCIFIKVEETDGLPQNICETCTTRLCKIYKFKKLCLESESLLQQTLKYNIDLIKTEDDTEPMIKKEPESYEYIENNFLKRKRTCHICNKTMNRESYWHHKQLHADSNRPYQCSKCPASFSLRCNLKRHVMIHTGEKPHLCDHCGKSFIQATTLIEHKRTHTGEKPHECNRCGKRWSQYSSYKTHLNKLMCGRTRRRNIDKFECADCCGLFESKYDLKLHSCEDSPLDCKICGRKFITRNALKIHTRTHNQPKLYFCSLCNETFTLRVMYTRHMTRHRDTEHICNVCGKGFSNYSGLWSHRKIHTGDQPYICSICGRAFSQAGSLKSHMLIHTGEKPFSCTVCDRTFTQRNHLKYHMRTHSGEKPYTCKYCRKSFSLNGTLTVHIRTHTGETPYHCDVCNKGFYDSSSMKKHRRGHDIPKKEA